AERVTPIVSGPVEVAGLKVIDRLEPNEKASIEFGLRPKEVGTMDLDFEVHYARPLDDGKHQTTDTAVVRVEIEGGYPIEDAFLFHSTGALIVHDGLSLGPLEDSPVSKIPALIERGLLEGDGPEDFLQWARTTIEQQGYDGGLAVLKRITDATVGPTEEISHQIQQAILASKEAGTLQITDDQVNTYVDFLRKSLEAAFAAKRRAGIERYWPVARIAVKTTDQRGYDAVGAFRKVIVGQSGAKELDIVGPDDMWRGMKIDVQVHMNSVSAAYKLWS